MTPDHAEDRFRFGRGIHGRLFRLNQKPKFIAGFIEGFRRTPGMTADEIESRLAQHAQIVQIFSLVGMGVAGFREITVFGDTAEIRRFPVQQNAQPVTDGMAEPPFPCPAVGKGFPVKKLQRKVIQSRRPVRPEFRQRSRPEIRLVNDRYFSIKRFDIKEGRRIHTLTAAALLQSDFRTQSIDYVNLLALTGYLTQDPAQVEQMFRRMIFNILCDNKDDHAKNFSFLCENGKWSLAPAYDITYSPEGTKGEHATSVRYSGNPSLEDIISAGTGIRISRKRCIEIIDEIESVCNAELDIDKTVKIKKK